MAAPGAARADTFAPTDLAGIRRHFDDAGYAIVRGVFDAPTLRAAQAGCEALVDGLAARLLDEGRIQDALAEAPFDARLARLCLPACPSALPNLFRSELHRPEFFPLLANPTLLDVVSSLMCPDVERVRIYPNYSCRPKTKSKLHSVAWHQDAGLRADGGPSTAPMEQRLDAFGLGRVVNCWTPLVPATRENGAMKFVPGSQKGGILEHQLIGSYEGSTGGGEALPQAADAAAVSGAPQAVPAGTYKTAVRPDLLAAAVAAAGGEIDVECGPGDVVLFSNILIHRGGVNTTDKIRWSFDWRFQDAAKNTYRAERGHVVWSRPTLPGAAREQSDAEGSRDAQVHTPEQWAQRRLD